MIIQRTQDVYCGVYRFADLGGAVGAYNLQVPLPVNLMLTEFGAVAYEDLAGGVGATISFDLIDISVNPFTTVIGGAMAAQLITDMPTNFISYGVAPIPQSFLQGIKLTTTYSIGISIGVADLTAGSIQFWARGVAFDF